MYFRKDETQDPPTLTCTNSTGDFVAAIVKTGGPSPHKAWQVQLAAKEAGGKEEVVAKELELEEAIDYILSL